ncbi:GntR family transcriptional regulator [Nocardiopsis trehalosi]|uniref:GntR family transcriptional regulator n=1 Tax=Nocardiopsis trehalosi TaxID=109329 RepID=UPI000A06EB74|nr:GntR family transcriptional regulator [Nocardiopsis trehalosi]
MPFEYTPPKYARVVAELQRRITQGDYPPGTLMPSEAQLTQEFDVARPTVVRALQVLRQDGWIESQQGKGRYVLGQPALEQVQTGTRKGADLVEPILDGRQERVLSVGREQPPNRLRGLLGSDDNLFLRRTVLVSQDGDPLEMVSIWVPLDIAAGTDLESTDALPEGLRRHLETKKGVRFDHVLEQVTARLPTQDEVRTLELPERTALLVVHASIRDATGRPLLVLSVLMPADRHELEDAYSLV